MSELALRKMVPAIIKISRFFFPNESIGNGFIVCLTMLDWLFAKSGCVYCPAVYRSCHETGWRERELKQIWQLDMPAIQIGNYQAEPHVAEIAVRSLPISYELVSAAPY